MSGEEPPPWWGNASKILKEEVVNANKRELQTELAPVLKDVGDCKARLTTVEAKQEAMQKEIQEIKHSGSSSTAQDLRPKWLSINGFCEFSEVRTKRVTSLQATAPPEADHSPSARFADTCEGV